MKGVCMTKEKALRFLKDITDLVEDVGTYYSEAELIGAYMDENPQVLDDFEPINSLADDIVDARQTIEELEEKIRNLEK